MNYALISAQGIEAVCGVMRRLMELSWTTAGPKGRQVQLSVIAAE